MSNHAPPRHDEFAEATHAALAAFDLDATALTAIASWNQPIFRVDTPQGSYALRWHPPHLRTEAHIRGELAFLQHLAASGLAVPKPIPAVSGDLLLTVEASGVAQYCCDVTTWLEGEVRRGPRDGLDPHAAYKLGRTLARLHLASRTFLLPPEADLPTLHAPVEGDEAWPYNPEPLEPWFTAEDTAFIREVMYKARAAFASFVHHSGEIGAIHNDFILGNCLWQGNNLRVLDFGDCGFGLYLYDLAPMLTNLGSAKPFRDRFLEGYMSLSPLSAEHQAALPVMEAVRHVAVCLWLLGKAQRGEVVPSLERHFEVRMAEIRELSFT